MFLRSGALSGLLACSVLSPGATTDIAAQFAAGTELVEVYVTVSDPAGHPVTGLPQDAFTVLEDGVPQTITAFAAGSMPLALGVGVDRSFSMAGRPLIVAKAGARRLLDALEPSDQAMVVAVGSRIETLAPLSSDRIHAREVVASLQPWGTSPLGDAVTAAIASVAEGVGRRALALFTDGQERYNASERSTVLDHVRRSRVLIYPVAVGGKPTALLAELAAVSGGRSFEGRDERTVAQAADAIADELRHQYLLGYTPKRGLGAGMDAWRSIRVRVSRPQVAVRARDGYFAGAR